ncbi:MAG TPA: potassium channel protein [Syntrophomonadaceae bacterium]|nr:potassium channel protein [Syntrophomonadaceae bacterium]
MKKVPLWARLLACLLLIILLSVFGIKYLEGYSFLDALWFTVVSLTAVGYGDIVPVTPAGKIFTMIFTLFGIGFVLYVLGTGFAVIVEGRLSEVLGRQSMQRKISKLDNHIIICGAGRVGREVIERFQHDKIPFVVIENDESVVREMREQGILVLEGDATADSTLIEAGIHRARGLIATLPSDADNVFITLTCKELNPGIKVAARASREDSESKLMRAGADKVIAPEAIGGRRLAISILKPATVEFVDTILHDHRTEIEIEEIVVLSESPLVNKSIRESRILDKTGTLIIAIKREDEFIGVPRADEEIRANDLLIAIGTGEQLTKLEAYAGGNAVKEV